MSDFLRDPPRWKDRTDQARLAERAAGKIVRTMGTAEPLSGPQLARIAARVRDHKPRPHRLRFWAPAMAVLLFGGVAAASAARIDILPRWFVDIVRPGLVPAPSPRAPRGKPLPQTPAPRQEPAAVPALVPQVPLPAAEVAPTPQVLMPAAEPAPAAGEPRVQPIVSPQPIAIPRPLVSERARETNRKPGFKVPQAARPQPAASRSAEGQSSQPASSPSAVVMPSQPAELPRVSLGPSPAQPAAAPLQPPSAVSPFEPTAPAPALRSLAWADRPTPARPVEPARLVPETQPAAPAQADPGAGPMKHLSAAVRALRVEHSPAAALELLDRHAGELDKSSVGHEALLLRVEAMLKLERRGEVLKLLDTAALAGVAASRTLLLTRGELRARAGRCAEAIADFDLVLVQTQGKNKRAQTGRSQCLETVPGGGH